MSYAPWSAPAIFNVLDLWVSYGGSYVPMVANDASFADQNTAVLQGLIKLAQEYTSGGHCPTDHPYGAIILFPGQSILQDQGGGGTDVGSVYYLRAPHSQTFAVEVACNWPVHFLGTGSVVLMMIENGDTPALWGDMFYLHSNTGQSADIGGLTFEDIHFAYDNDPDNPAYGAAIHTVPAAAMGDNDGAQNVRLARCIFDDCPTAAWFEQAVQPMMFDCTTTYNKNVGSAIMLGASNNGFEAPSAKECHIANCVFRGAPGVTAMTIVSADHLRVDNVKMDGFGSGIEIVPAMSHNVVRCDFSNVSCYVGVGTDGVTIGTGLTIKTDNTDGNDTFISQLTFTACAFETGDSNELSTQSSGPGILISQATNTKIVALKFVSCWACRFPGPGMFISGGIDIEITGGMYSGNNLGSESGGTPASQPYGIYATGVEGLRITGVSCVGNYDQIILYKEQPAPTQDVGIYIDTGSSDVIITGCDVRGNNDEGIVVSGASGVTISGCDLTANTDYGILVNSGASDVNISACDVRGNGTNGIIVDASTTAVANIFIRDCNATGTWAYSTAINIVNGTGSAITNAATVQVTDCAGYNDQGPALTALVVSLGTANIQNYKWGYWGSLEFYVKNGTATISSITVDGHTTNLLQGSFYLAPGEKAAVTFSPSTSTIDLLVVGK